MNLLARWIELFRKLEVQGSPVNEYNEIAGHYSERHRVYHTLWNHLEPCFRQFEEIGNLLASPQTVELALWFHDISCCPQVLENERKSARMLRNFCARVGISGEISKASQKIVLATRYSLVVDVESRDILVARLGETSDEKFCTDIDLSIFGAEEEEFDCYDEQIWEEYSPFIKRKLFARRRSEFLEAFLRRRIFETDFFFEKYEEQARHNLERAIARLRS